ncbi:hypothetical protein PG995_006671 [Apiospora arundinis]
MQAYSWILQALLETHRGKLHSQLSAEPSAIVALAVYNTAENPIDILGIAETAGKKQVKLYFMLNTLPVFFHNMETATFERGHVA